MSKDPSYRLSIAEAHASLTAVGMPYEVEEKLIHGVPTLTWKHIPQSLREVFLNGMRFKQREFLIYEGDRVTFDAFGRATLALAHRLLADGVRKGDRVAVAMRNLPEWPVAFFAGQLVGAIVTPLNAWWTGAELAYGIANSGSKVAIVDAERLERLCNEFNTLPALEKVYVARTPDSPLGSFVSPLDDLLGRPEAWANLPELPLPDVSIEPEHDATILYTSGTTGKSKGALGTHRNITSSIATASFAIARDRLRRGLDLPDSGTTTSVQRVSLLAVPLFHINGLALTLIPAVNNGSKVVLMHRWEPELAIQLIEKERVNQTGGVPTIAWHLVEHPARKQYDLSSLSLMMYGGAPSAPDLGAKVREAFPGINVGTGWAMTEVSGVFTRNLGTDYARLPESAGLTTPVGKMEIRDLADGVTVLPANAIGELWVKGPQVIKEYWKNEEATAATFVNGWVRTGDMARIDENGYLFIIDRLKDMLIRGGENIYCAEVEVALLEHPDVLDAALVGIPHKTLGEEPGAIVYVRPGVEITETALRDLVGSKLAAFKVPVRIVFWPEPLPRNPIGKLVKSELKQVFTSSAQKA